MPFGSFGFSRSHPPSIGVDFGADRLKVIQVQGEDPGELIGAASIEMPHESRNAAAERLGFLEQELPKLIKSQAFKGRRAILSMPAVHTIVQQLEIEVAPDISLDDQINGELQGRLGIDPQRMLIRHEEVNTSGKGNQREFVCLAAPRDIVMRYIDLARKCRLDPVGMYAEPHALLTSFGFMNRRATDDQRAVAYIDIGGATTTVVIAHGMRMVFAKAVPIGGDQFIREQAVASELSFAQAREARITSLAPSTSGASSAPAATTTAEPVLRPTRRSRLTALADDFDSPNETSSAPAPQPASPAKPVSEALDCLVDEVTLCIRHHHNKFPEVPLERLVFAGGEAACTPSCQAIAKAVRTAAQLGDPISRLQKPGRLKQTPGLDLRRPEPAWSVALGLSLSEPNL